MLPKLIAGNWKMNGSIKDTRKLLFQLAVDWGKECEGIEVVVCPPFTSLVVAKHELELSHIKLGAQNCYVGEQGAFTGEISAQMLADLGCQYVILGHSERRTIFLETDQLIARKMRSALESGLKPILCIGETEQERTANETEAVLAKQLEGSLAGINASDMVNVTIAYEPVWAIGTGKTATPELAEAVHLFIRNKLRVMIADQADAIRILYGGSMKPDNAQALLAQPNIDGGLIGGASLDAGQFIAIIEAGAARV